MVKFDVAFEQPATTPSGTLPEVPMLAPSHCGFRSLTICPETVLLPTIWSVSDEGAAATSRNRVFTVIKSQLDPTAMVHMPRVQA